MKGRLGSKIGVSKMGVGKMALIHPTVQPYHWVRSSTVLHGCIGMAIVISVYNSMLGEIGRCSEIAYEAILGLKWY